jgi:hypothetical protein
VIRITQELAVHMGQAWWALGVLIAVAGCGGAKGNADEGGATVSVDEGTVVPETALAAVDTVNPYEGVWDLATIRGHLARAGISTTEQGEVRQPFMGARGTRLRGDKGEFQVFIYADAGARARDTDRLDSNALLLPAESGTGRRRASVVTANNLAVIVVGEDSALVESVSGVLRPRRD